MIKKIAKFWQRGTVLIISFLVLGVLFLLGTYFLGFTVTESKISKSQGASVQTYYLAEAGINEAIWKLKNDNTTADGDPAWADDFIDASKNPDINGNYWSASFNRSLAGGSYSVSVQNSGRGKGQIITIATVPLAGGKTARRVVKTTVFKALASPIQDSAVFSGGASENIDVDYSKIQIDKGNLFSNNHLSLKGLSTVQVIDNPDTKDILEGQALVVGNYLNNNSSLISTAICAKNYCTPQCSGYIPPGDRCPPSSISVPLVDFDSTSPNSFKSRAQQAQNLGQCQVLCNGVPCDNKCVFTAAQFEDLLWQVGQNGTLTLNSPISYVTGNIHLRGGRRLVVHGAILADDNVAIGESLTWKKQGHTDIGFSQITIDRPQKTKPSGLLTKRKISFGLFSSFMPINIRGLIYANDVVNLSSIPSSAQVIGGIIGRKVYFSSLWQWFYITLDNDIILYGLGYKIDGEAITPTYSPVITIDHWEETY